mmetsp:Transcript_116029/g.173372  ORF Transcript_116029/g.173372 Transcript_116029/m.173372 type:complete len:182 (-) Transcript_116029:142-687(-)
MLAFLSSSSWWSNNLYPDHIPHDSQTCFDTNCALLPLGYLLLTSDICFDLQYVLNPSGSSAQRLMGYYQSILTPSFYSPGYFFPFYATYQLCVRCYSPYNLVLLLLWLPIAKRYTTIYKVDLTNEIAVEDCHSRHGMLLKHWWTVILLRLALYYVTYIDYRGCGCSTDTWTEAMRGFMGVA